MTNDIRQSLSRLGQVNSADLDAASAELTTLLAALRKEVENRTGVVNAADRGRQHPVDHHQQGIATG